MDTTVKINLHQTLRPEIGDQFSTRHGQKGVLGYYMYKYIFS
jgi:DNA-directed RNA polymerase beta subunit